MREEVGAQMEITTMTGKVTHRQGAGNAPRLRAFSSDALHDSVSRTYTV
jgi:hypothetical protein